MDLSVPTILQKAVAVPMIGGDKADIMLQLRTEQSKTKRPEQSNHLLRALSITCV